MDRDLSIPRGMNSEVISLIGEEDHMENIMCPQCKTGQIQ